MAISATADLPLTRQPDSNGGGLCLPDPGFADSGRRNGYESSSWIVNRAGSVEGSVIEASSASDLETAPRQYSFALPLGYCFLFHGLYRSYSKNYSFRKIFLGQRKMSPLQCHSVS